MAAPLSIDLRAIPSPLYVLSQMSGGTCVSSGEYELITYPTWKRYSVLAHVVSALSVRERRELFQLIRKAGDPSGDILFPRYGFTLSEFAVWHVLSETKRKSPKK